MNTECYCAALRLAARKVSVVYDDALAPLNINIAQYSLLRRIERAGSGSLTELGRLTGLDRSTVGRNTKVLERARLIETVTGEDGRETCIVLAPAGKNLLEAAAPLWRRAQRKFESTLGGDAAGMLRQLLQDF